MNAQQRADELNKILNNPEEHYPDNFDTPQRANALLTGLCQEAATEIERLNKALTTPPAQPAPVQEPVAYRSRLASGGYTYCNTPQFFDNAEPLYTTPPAQPAAWVGLTDEEAQQIRADCATTPPDLVDVRYGWAVHYARAIEAKLREKNGGAARPEPDMYWDDDDSERPASDSIPELLYDRWNNGDLEVGYEVSMTCAKQMEPLTVRVTGINEDTYDIEYEVVKKGGA